MGVSEDKRQKTEDREQKTEHVPRSHVPRGNAARTLQRPVRNAEA